jgi:tetratricopeptide (TPR) repeat protein
MPFIEGETLRQRLMREKRIEITMAVRIAEEIAGALEYAHTLGIVHRDIKPENVMFSGDHAIVTDFGIARAVHTAEHTLTQPGSQLGTPRYMSPEQWDDTAEVDGRSDVYSLGMVLLEMIAGGLLDGHAQDRLAWIPDVANDALRDSRARAALVSVLRRALAVQPAQRFATAQEFRDALLAVPLPFTTPTEAGKAKPGRRIGTGLFVGAVVVVVAILVSLLVPRGGEALGPSRVVVSVFDNRTGDSSLAPLGPMAADWITQGLAQTGLVEIVGMRTTLGSEAMRSAQDRVMALADETGARIVVWGDFYRIGETIQFQAKITDATEGRLLRALDPVGSSMGEPLVAIEELRQRVMGALAAVVDQRLTAWGDEFSRPPSFTAYQHYVEGMTQFMSLNARDAIAAFHRAAEADSTFVAPLLFAAFAHSTEEEWADADSLAQIVDGSRERLGPLDTSLLDWILATTRGDHRAALMAIRRATGVAPTAEMMILQGITALSLNRPSEALASFRNVDPERGFTRGFFLYWDYVTSALHTLGRHREELGQARRGRRQFPSHASIVEHEMRAAAALDQLSVLDSLWDVLRAMPPQPQSWWMPGDVARQVALELRAHGNDERSVVGWLDRSLAWYGTLSDIESRAERHQYGRARTHYVSGNYDAARAEFADLRRLHPDSVGYLGYLGATAARRGDRNGALAIADSLERLQRPHLFGQVAYWQARIAAVLGERERAVTLLRDALAAGFLFDVGFHTDVDLQRLYGYEPFDVILRPAGVEG